MWLVGRRVLLSPELFEPESPEICDLKIDLERFENGGSKCFGNRAQNSTVEIIVIGQIQKAVFCQLLLNQVPDFAF